MKRILILILLQIGLYSFGQSTRIDTLFLHKDEKSIYVNSNQFKFPVVRTGSENIDLKINSDLRRDFFNDNDRSLESDLEWVDESLIYLGFWVTFNRNGVLSLNINAESCGAYCTIWTSYYSYSTVTGERLNIDDVVYLSEEFKEMVVSDKDSQYTKEKDRLERMRSDINSGLDEEDFNLAVEYYENCQKSFQINEFVLHDDYLQIICECNLPRMIRNLTPVVMLKYRFDSIKGLKIKTATDKR